MYNLSIFDFSSAEPIQYQKCPAILDRPLHVRPMLLKAQRIRQLRVWIASLRTCGAELN